VSDAQIVLEEGSVVRHTDEVLNEASLRFLEEIDPPILYLDLSGVQLPTAEGLGALILLNKELRTRGGALVLFNVPAAVYEVFAVTRLVEVLDVRAE